MKSKEDRDALVEALEGELRIFRRQLADSVPVSRLSALQKERDRFEREAARLDLLANANWARISQSAWAEGYQHGWDDARAGRDPNERPNPYEQKREPKE